MKKLTKTQTRVDWIQKHRQEILIAKTDDHAKCRGKCKNGATCYNQGCMGMGWWANALDIAGIDPERMSYWTGPLPTPSTSINKGVSNFIMSNAPISIR